MVKDQNIFLIKIEDFKIHIFEFKENSKIKPKISLLTYTSRENNW